MEPYADYLHFNADDFLSDSAFRQWVARPTPETNAYWWGLLKSHPHLRSPFEEGRVLAQGMQATWTTFPDTYTDSLYRKLLGVLPVGHPPVKVKPVFWLFPRWAYASVASLLLLAGLFGYWFFFREQLVQTGNAELATVKLYDGSVVTLNANSQLRVPGRLAWREQRQVWLIGEGSFAVRKQPGDEASSFRKFTVHTHRINVVVLGTHFTIYTRPRRTQVLLEEGRIVLTDPTTHHTQTMQPGRLVAYTDEQEAPQLSQLTPSRQQPLTAWRENRLVFENASMDELAGRFLEVYGLKLILRGDAFVGQEFRGVLPVNNLDKALLIVSETFGLEPVRQRDEVYFVTD